jgi:hypothetical protein
LRGLGEQSDKRTGLEQGRFGHLSRSLCRRCHTVSLSRSQGLGRKIMVEYCTKNGQALRSEPRIDTRRHLGYPSGTLELGEVSGTSQYSRSVFGERLEDFGTTTVWSTLVCTESDFSRERDRLAEMAANLKTMAAAIMEMAHTAAQKAVQDRLMSGNVHDAIKISCGYFLHDRRSPYPGDLLEQRLLRLENPSGHKRKCLVLD